MQGQARGLSGRKPVRNHVGARSHQAPVPVNAAQHGYVLLWMLFLVASLGVGMASLGTLWHTAAQRDKEQQLLFVGNEYRRAIESFQNIALPAGQQARLPKTLDELLLDPRFPHTVRHLRRLYPDPMTGTAEWGLLKDGQNGIGGVFSLSEAKPMKTAGFAAHNADFAGQASYRGWMFMANAAGAVAAATDASADDATGINQGPSKNDAQGGGAQNSDSGADSGNLERARRIAACSTARLKANLGCGGLLEQGNKAAWQACMATADTTYNACMAST